MNNNTLAAILIGGVVVLGGGYLLVKNKNNDVVNPPTNVTVNSGSQNSSTATAPTKKAPEVETGSSLAVSSSTGLVSGRVRPNGASTSYWYEYGKTTSFGSKTVTQSIGSGFIFVSTPAYITGLAANTVYYFRLSAKNSLGTVNGSTNTFSTNNTPPTPGTTPTATTTSATSISRTTANLNGQINPRGFDTDYWFEYGKGTDLGQVTNLQSAGDGSTLVSKSASISDLEPATKYYFRLNAQNRYGTVNGAMLSFTTLGPPAFSTVTTAAVSDVTNSSATLKGQVNPNGENATYWFEYSKDAGLALSTTTEVKNLDKDHSLTNVEQSITGLEANTKYYYRLVGRNSHGTVPGTILSFTTSS